MIGGFSLCFMFCSICGFVVGDPYIPFRYFVSFLCFSVCRSSVCFPPDMM